VPALAGMVRDVDHGPVRGAVVVVLDSRGRQLVTTVTDEQGRYAVGGLPEGHLGIVASAPGRHPLALRKLLRAGETVDADFTLRGREETVVDTESGRLTVMKRPPDRRHNGVGLEAH
jgi:hypothetical protein